MKKLKIKKLVTQKKNDFLYMAIEDNKAHSRIYLHRVSEKGALQWYESKKVFTEATALKYFYNGQYKVVFAKGITISNVKEWV